MERSNSAAVDRNEPRLAAGRSFFPALQLLFCLWPHSFSSTNANQFYLHLANLVLFNAIFAISLGLIASVGQMSLMHRIRGGRSLYIALAALDQASADPGIVLADRNCSAAALIERYCLSSRRGFVSSLFWPGLA